MYLSVVICTYNPNPAYLKKVLDALRNQTLDIAYWELLLIDNNSSRAIKEFVELSWHPNAKIISESKAGLSFARITGVTNSKTDLIVFVDDDNVLNDNYLALSYQFYVAHPEVGSFGGKSLPEFETDPPGWFKNTGINLGCQDYGDELYISKFAVENFNVKNYPEKAPIGTGMVIQKKAFIEYAKDLDEERLSLGRKGLNLTSGEDNDIILTIAGKGYEIAYVPELVVFHLIPKRRISIDYLQKMAFESSRSWIKVLALHGIYPWKKISQWSYPLRKIKSYFSHRAWTSADSFIRWKASCGTFKGLSELT